MTRLLTLWRNLRHRARVERELDEEIRATVDLLVDEKTRTGISAEEARRKAMLELGGMESVKQRTDPGDRSAEIRMMPFDSWRSLRVSQTN